MFVRVVSLLSRIAFISGCCAVVLSANATAADLGLLKCRFDGIDAAIHFGAKRELACRFQQKYTRRKDHYVGRLELYGIEVGIIGKRQLVWRVTSKHKRRLRRGALAGRYKGVIAEASVGAGVAASILTGGPSKSYHLHPLAFQKVEGLNVAAGVLILTLTRRR